MNKEQLSKEVAKRLNISGHKAEDAIGAVFDAITAALSNGESVRIQNFGFFYPKYSRERKTMDFAQNKMNEKKPRITPGFRAGKLLKDSVMNISNIKDEGGITHDE